MNRIDDLGGRGAKFPPLLGGARLHDDRMTLRHAGNIQRTAHVEEPAPVVEHMHLGFVEIAARRLVEQQGAVLPAVPQPLDHLDEFGRARIARVVVERCLQAEVLRLVFRPRCDDVPAGTAVADQIQRGKLARQVIRLVVRRGRRRHQTDMPRDHGERRQQRHRLHLDHVRAGAAQRAGRIVALADAGAVGEEDQIELAALGDLRIAHIMLDMQRAIGWYIRMAPGRRVVAIAADRHAQSHLACRHHASSEYAIRSCVKAQPQGRPVRANLAGLAVRYNEELKPEALSSVGRGFGPATGVACVRRSNRSTACETQGLVIVDHHARRVPRRGYDEPFDEVRRRGSILDRRPPDTQQLSRHHRPGRPAKHGPKARLDPQYDHFVISNAHI